MSGSGNIEDWVYKEKIMKVHISIEDKKYIELHDMNEEQIDDMILILASRRNVIVSDRKLQEDIKTAEKKWPGIDDKEEETDI